MRSTVRWDVELTALSSISQKGEESETTTTLFRREPILQPDGRKVLVPVVSGNSLRGALRRTAEELFRDVIGYERQIPLSAAHALRNGGNLSKVAGDSLTGRRRQRLRELVPPISLFGGNGGGAPPIDGCLKVGKVVPRVKETESIMSRPYRECSCRSSSSCPWKVTAASTTPEPSLSLRPSMPTPCPVRELRRTRRRC